MKMIFTLSLLLILTAANSQLLNWSPNFITSNTINAVITTDANYGNKGLLGHITNDVYVHIGVITTLSTGNGDWKHVQTEWTTSDPKYRATPLGGNKWSYTIADSLYKFFGIPANSTEKILKIAILFHAGDTKLANADGSDMYVPVYDAGLQTRITQPYSQPTFTPVPEPVTYAAGDAVPVTGKSSQVANLTLYYNGSVIATATDSVISASHAAVSGNNVMIVGANSGAATKYDTLSFFINTPVITKDLPAGVRDGLNYGSDGTSVTLVLYAPDKTRAAVIGDFNNWTQTAGSQMYRTTDGNRYWITLTSLTPGQEYAYQYLVDGTIKVADMFAEKILDPNNDPYIDAQTYPNLKQYPAGQTGIVSVLQTAKPAYTWQVPNFAKPDKRNLVIYELLVRDFVAAHNWQTVKDSIPYLKRLGVNAIEVMPFNEFEGNISWGYNPDFFFAPDKYYGTETAMKQFIDECHKQGIAVIMDLVMNHAFGSSPTVQLYWDGVNNRPAANNPWHNEVAPHPASVGYDFNHESPATQELVERVIEHWLTDYKVDGFRWDLSKGFTQKYSGDNYTIWGAYDTSRVTTWKRYYDTMQSIVPGSYCILEHFADNSEETDLSNYGMMLWGNLNYSYNQATMGYVGPNDGSDVSWGIYTARGWSNPNLVTYIESHDEERLMYKNEQYGNSSGNYNVKNIPTGLARDGMAAAFWAMQPAPKLMWQFGELGYDYSINTCEDGVTINNDCRTNPKPIRWDYLNDANRLALHNVYARLFALRNYASYLPAFTAPADSIKFSLDGAFKWETFNSAPLDIAVIGNFDVVQQSGTVTFSHAGVWYDYLKDSAFNVTATTQTYTLQPGEYHVFIDQNASLILPVQLIAFSGNRNAAAINLAWTTTNERNLQQFVVERSLDGRSFTAVGTVTAGNSSYTFADKDAAALNATGNVYYRLKMIDKDSISSYSIVIGVLPFNNRNVIIYPNPAKTGVVYVQLNTTVSGKAWISVVDAAGKTYSVQNVQLNSGTTKLPVNISTLASGIYTIKIDGPGKQSITQKLVVQH